MEKPKWLEIAEGEKGTHEIEPGSTPRIVEYHQTTGLRAQNDLTPWCSSFANWVMRQAGLHGTGSAAARSWLKWGVPLDIPRLGCIVVMRRGTSATLGHVGFYVRDEGPNIVVLGGNQGDCVKESRYSKATVLGYRWPKEE